MLKNKVAVVTGASRGIGKAIALELAENGADIIINYRGSEEEANETLEEIKAKGVKAMALQCDVSKLDDVDAFIKKATEEFGKIDILVNNAGITKDMLVMRMKEEDFDKVIDVNLKGVFNCTKSIINQMIKQRSGRIINITSVIGQIGNVGQANYAASKAGVIGFTKSVAKEVGARGITVNAVAPGFIETKMTGVLSDKVKDSILTNIPMKKMGQPEDVAKMVKFLASEDAKYVTGQVLNIDGGMVM